MSGETVSNKSETSNEQVDTAEQRLKEAIERIKQPPSIDETIRELKPDEIMSNPTVVPEMLNEPGNLRGDLSRE